MKALSKILVLLSALLSLAGCGGGGSNGNGNSGGAFTGGTYSLAVTPGTTTLAQNAQTTINVAVKNPDGTTVSNGLTVSLAVTPIGIGTVGATASSTGNTATGSTSGGIASFVFLSAAQGGTAHVVASVQNTNGTASSAAVDIAISSTPTNDPRLQLTSTTTTLPLNPYNPEDGSQGFPGNYLGSPYIAEVTLEWRHSNGQLVSGTLKANVAISPTTVAGYSTLDDPTTPWTGQTTTPPTAAGNEFLTIMGSGQVNVTAGIGTIFVHSFDTPGTAVLTVTATDPDSNQTISSQISIAVAGAATNKLPGAVTISQAAGGVYVSGSNGPQSKLVSATVTDGNGALVADPSDGQGHSWDNVQFQIIGPSGTDAKLTATNAAGTSQTGTTVVTTTHNGIASVSFQAGTQQGPVQVKATVDRGDNNVDNQIQDPVSATASVVVSDGKLYSLTLTSPGSNSVAVNTVSGDASTTSPAADPNASYSFTVSAVATDRQGNPVTPGTVLSFGSIDTPQSNFFFNIAGVQGDPTEGGNTFFANDGHFLNAGGGAGPGDTLIVFGKQAEGAPAGNDDLESALKVASVNSNTSLTTVLSFNWNDTTGSSQNYGAVLPYIVGRATIGNISSPATTNSLGVATTTLNYPVSALNKTAAVWVQGTGTDTVTSGTKLVTDAAISGFPGVAPAQITINPTPIVGDTTASETVCIYDAESNPLPGVVFAFGFSGLGSAGTGSVDGTNATGNTANATGADGCVVTSVTTAGLDSSDASAKLAFSAAGATASAPITASGSLVLQASLGAPVFSPQPQGLTLTLLDSHGTPVPGVQLSGTCTAGLTITSGPAATDGNGRSVVSVLNTLAAASGTTPAATGTCTFSVAGGSPSVTVNFSGPAS